MLVRLMDPQGEVEKAGAAELIAMVDWALMS